MKVNEETKRNCFWTVGQGDYYFLKDEWSGLGVLEDLALCPVNILDKLHDYENYAY